MIPACCAVKCELISGNPCSFNKLDSQINKSVSFANSANFSAVENDVSDVYTIFYILQRHLPLL